MKINTIVVSCACLVFFALNSMEERPSIQSIKQNPEVEQKFVRLDVLNDEGESLYSIRVPASFARESSVIHNNLQFQEEEEGVEPNVPLRVSDIGVEGLKLLEELLSHNYQQEKQKAIRKLVDNWYAQRNLPKLPALITLANYIGNEDLLRHGIKVLFKLLRIFDLSKNWALIFYLIPLIKPIELQEKLSKKIRKISSINNVINNFYPVKNEAFGKLNYCTGYDIAVGKDRWVAAVLQSNDKNIEIIKQIAIIDIQAQKPVTTIPINKIVEGYIKISPLGDLVIVGGIRLSLRDHNFYTIVYSIKTGQNIFQIPMKRANSFCFSQDGALIVVVGDEKVSIYHSNTLELKQEFPIDSKMPSWITMSPNQRLIAFGVTSGIEEDWIQRIELWDIQQQKKINEFIVSKPHNVSLNQISFSPNNNYLAYGFYDGRVAVRDLQNGNKIVELHVDEKDSRLPTFAFSPNSKLLATGFAAIYGSHFSERTVNVWDLRSAKLVKEIKSYHKKIKDVSFSHDGDTLAYIASEFVSDLRTDQAFFYKIDMYNKKLKEFLLEPLMLLWYFSEHLQTGQPFIIPKNFESAFYDLPIEIRKKINEFNQQRGGPIFRLNSEDEEADQDTQPEKRKEVSEGEDKKPKLRPFKRSKKD